MDVSSGNKTPTSLSPGIHRILLAASVALLIVAIGTGILLWKQLQSDKKDDTAAKRQATAAATNDSQEDEPQSLSCADPLTAYQNQDLKVGFCYPVAWGVIDVKDSKFAPTDTGERWSISFANKPQVHLNLKSTDWTTTQGRDSACADLTADLPAFDGLKTEWVTVKDADQVVSASRMIAMSEGKYLIFEEADSTLLNGDCLRGYTVIADTKFETTTATYWVAFDEDGISNPEKHIADSDKLVSATDRTAFADFVKSVVAL